MLLPLSETLTLMEPHIPRQLISASSYSQAVQIATSLPKVTSSCYWECRLAANAPQVDFLTCVAASDGGREILVDPQVYTDLPRFFLEAPVWNQARDFFRKWAEPTSVLHKHVPLIWLEFDHVDGPVPEVPLPSFSFCLDPLYADRRLWEQYVNSRDPQKRYEVAEKGLQLLFGCPLSPQRKKALLSCFEVLPAGGRIIHISAMLARQPAVVKVYGSVPKEQLFPYLAQIGWSGSTTELADILTTFCTSSTVDHNMYIDLSVGENVLSRIGIAFAQQQIENLSDKDPQRQNLLDLCVKNGLCTLEKREALIGWPGSFRTLFSEETWPTRFRKWLDVKLVYQPDYPLEAKGYLGFMPQFSLF